MLLVVLLLYKTAASSSCETQEEALGEVDIEEDTRRRRFVKRVETRNANTHEATGVAESLCVTVDLWERHRPCRPCSS